MCIKTNLTDRKLNTSLHSADALKHISKESFRTGQWPINVPPMKPLYSLVKKTLRVIDAAKQQKHSWRRSLQWRLNCWYVSSVRIGCGSSRSWMSDLSVQDGSLTFRPFQSSGIAFQRIPCYWPAALEGSCPSSSAPVSSLLWQQNDSFRNHSFWKSQWLTSMAHVLYRGLVRFACIKQTFSV